MDKESTLLAPQPEAGDGRLFLQSPWVFVSTLYFAEGMPYILLNSVSVVLYKNLGIDNAQIAFWTSLLYFPWIIKMIWGPLIDRYSTKRNWILVTQFIIVVCLGSFAMALQLPNFMYISLFVLVIAAFAGATQDTAVDGFYMLSLDEDRQAFFVGIRSTCYRLAMLFGSGFLVFFAGQLTASQFNTSLSWSLTMGLAAMVFAVFSIFHWLYLPFPDKDSKQTVTTSIQKLYAEVIRTYFNQNRIWAVLAFIFLYRIGEAMLAKLAPPFFLDAPEVGGLGLSTSQVGLAYGSLGSFSVALGGVLGGWLVFRYGVKRSLVPMALALNLPDLCYVYLAYAQPSLRWVYPLIAIEQFTYGLGTAAYSVYLMYSAREAHKTSHFAISTGIMALGMMLPGLISGYVQQALGYQIFFIVVCLCTIPGMLTLLFLPLEDI